MIIKNTIKYFLVKLNSLKILSIGFVLNINFVWQIVNKTSINKFKKSKIDLSENESLILNDLLKDGVAITNIQELSEGVYENLISWKTERKKNFSPKSFKKGFLNYYLGGNHDSSYENLNYFDPLLEFSLSNSLLKIINSYFKLFSRLIYLEFNETKIVKKDVLAKSSQNFHRDPGIKGCIKVFIYLNDVEKGGGPFTYIKRTHKYGKYNSLFKPRFFGVGGVYPSLRDISEKIEAENIYEIYGKSGTVIIADTTGIHKGGFSTIKKREMTTSTYYPPGEYYKSKLIYDFDLRELDLSSIQKFAIKDF